MVSWNFIQWNIHYIRAVNSCDRAELWKLLDNMLKLPGGFTKKRYIWNTIRGKDFYKNLSHYVIGMVENVLSGKDCTPGDTMRKVEDIIDVVMKTEKRYDVRKSFVWNITKHCPLIMLNTIEYMSRERLTNILASGRQVAVDAALTPFVSAIINLREENADLKRQLDESAALVDALSGE